METTRPGGNPWLTIAASDYQARMGSPSVQQLQYIGEVFREILLEARPGTLAVLGCATGNGFEHISHDTRRVLGIDINRAYLDELHDRFAGEISELELICADLADCDLVPESLELVHAALVFEHVDPATVIEKLAGWLCPGGVLSVVLPLPVRSSGPVTETEYKSLEALEPVMRLVEPEALGDLAAGAGLSLMKSRVDTLATGKPFHVGWYVKD